MPTIEQRILKLEQQNPTGAGRITEIRWLIVDCIDGIEVCLGAYRTLIPDGVMTKIIGDELEVIQRDYNAKRTGQLAQRANR